MIDTFPLISCVCVTRNKPALLKRAVECFVAQSYINKELVIVYESDDHDSIALIEGGGLHLNRMIRAVCVSAVPKTTLGELRNIGITSASGQFVCQWDDDDWYHINRLTAQYKTLVKHNLDGSILGRWLVFDSLNKRAYISNERLWEGSVLCRKDTLQTKPYERKHIGEDTATIEYLVSMDYLALMSDAPGLYIYVYHGSNTWNFDHWSYIFECGRVLSPKASMDIADILEGKHSIYNGSLLLDDLLERYYASVKLSIDNV